MFKICFYVPGTHVETVKEALFAAGAGRIGEYECCSWQVLGTGQFRPGAGSDPFLGRPGEIEQVEEYQVEMVCADACIERALAALCKAHPYEEPAYQAWRLAELEPGAAPGSAPDRD